MYSLYNRVGGTHRPKDRKTFRFDHAWRYACVPFPDLGTAVHDPDEPDTPDAATATLTLHVLIEFPSFDLATVIGRLRADSRK